MSVTRNKNSKAYGLKNPLQTLSPEPILSQRNPTSADKAEFGTLWVNSANNTYFILTSNGTWTAQSAGSTTVASLDITGTSGDVLTIATGGDANLGGGLAVAGATVLAGDLTVDGNTIINGDFDLTSADAISFVSTADVAGAITLQVDGGTSETILIEAVQGDTLESIAISSTIGGVLINATNAVSDESIHLIAQSGGYHIEGVIASTIEVTGAGQDLTLNATGGSIKMTATESTAGAIALNASGVAGTMTLAGAGGVAISSTDSTISVASGTGAVNISADATANSLNLGTGAGAKTVVLGSTNSTSATTIDSGTGALNIGTSIAKAITIGNVTTTTGVTINSGTGGFAVNTTSTGDIVMTSADTVLIDSAGVLELNSSAGVIGIGNDAVAQNINIGTGAAARTITVGNVSGATGIVLNSGTGGVAVNTTGSGDVVVTSADTVLIDAAGVLELNSSAGVISIGNDAVAQNINVGTGAAARTITIGNNTGATTLSLQAGTAGAGAINIGTTANDTAISIGNVTGNTSVSLSSGGTITLDANSTGAINLVGKSVSAAAFTVTNNARVGICTLTGQTIAMSASQAITFNNSFISTGRPVLLSVSNLNVSTNGAFLTVDGVIQASGLLTINVTNNGAGNLDTTDTIIIGFQVIGN